MSKLRMALILALLLALAVPAAASAAGTFYCSALKSSGGNGSYANPWACSTTEQLNYVIYDTICNVYGGGHLYQIHSGSYNYYRIEWVTQNNQRACTITYRSEYPGYPPDTGVDLPMPLIVAAVVALAALMLVAGLALRRRSQAS